jgi:hypothetical protein
MIMREEVEAIATGSAGSSADLVISCFVVHEICTLALQALDMRPRPIAEAPKDGRSVILIDGKGATQGFWMEGVDSDHDTPGFPACWSNMSGDQMEPSHFIPLSSLPKVQP